MSLNKNHKIAIIALVIIVILGLGTTTSLLPAFNKIQASDNELADIALKISQAQDAQSQLSSLITKQKELFSKVQEAEKIFYPEETNSEMVKHVEDILKARDFTAIEGVKITDLTSRMLTLEVYTPHPIDYELRQYTRMEDLQDAVVSSTDDIEEFGKLSADLKHIFQKLNIGFLANKGEPIDETQFSEEYAKIKDYDVNKPEEYAEIMNFARLALSAEAVELGYYEGTFKIAATPTELYSFIDFIDAQEVATEIYFRSVQLFPEEDEEGKLLKRNDEFVFEYEVTLHFFIIDRMQEDPEIAKAE